MRQLFLAALLLLAPATARAQDDTPKAGLERVFPEQEFDRPTHVIVPPDGSGRHFICEQPGVVVVVEPGESGAEDKRSVAIDLRAKVRSHGNEEGLLSIAFHPKFKENGRVFLCYSTGRRFYPSDHTGEKRAEPVVTRVSEVKATGKTFDPKTEKTIIDGPQPFSNHNGGQIAFGPDGFLYFGLGDGGLAADPEKNGQNLSRLLAKILRIDVDKQDKGLAYSIPKDNPFVKEKGARAEIFAYGLRNPWRFCFAPDTGILWTGDVGQDKREMIRKVEKGTNQGWCLTEGNLPFRPGAAPKHPVVAPVWDYGRREGASVTGGFFYRGKAKSLQGAYVFGDYVTGHIWGLREKKDAAPVVWKLIEKSGKSISSFGEDQDGELLVVHHADRYGQLYRLRVAGGE